MTIYSLIIEECLMPEVFVVFISLKVVWPTRAIPVHDIYCKPDIDSSIPSKDDFAAFCFANDWQ